MTTTNLSFVPGGISLKYLEAMSFDGAETCNVNGVCKEIQTITKEAMGGGSLHSMLSASDITRPFTSEIAELFISYAWSYNWKTLLASIRHHVKIKLEDKDDLFIWIDVAIVDQNSTADKALSPSALSKAFGGTLEKIGKALIVFVPLENPIAVNRCWCVFEWFTIVKLKIPYDTVVPFAQEVAFIAKIQDERYLTVDYFNDRFAAIDVQNAKAREKEDELMIQSAIREFGIFAVNNVVILNLKLAYEQLLKNALMQTFLMEYAESTGSTLNRVNSTEQAKFNAYMSFGSVHLALEEYAIALNQFEQADKATHSLGPKERSDLYHSWGLAHAGLGHVDMAYVKFERAMLIRETMFDPAAQVSLADTLTHMGKIHLVRRDVNTAFDLLNKALDIIIPILSNVLNVLTAPRARVVFAETSYTVATACALAGQLDEALQQYENALEAFGSDHARRAIIYSEMGRRVFMKQRKWDDALQAYQSSLAESMKTRGRDNPSVAATHVLIATVYKAQKNKSLCLESLEKALETLSRADKNHPTHEADDLTAKKLIKQVNQMGEHSCCNIV